MLLTAAILAVAALALLGRQLWAYVFGLLFWLATGLGCATLAVVAGREALTRRATASGRDAQSRDRRDALLALALGGVSAMLGTTLWVAWRSVARPRSAVAWILSAAVALGGLGLVAGWSATSTGTGS